MEPAVAQKDMNIARTNLCFIICRMFNAPRVSGNRLPPSFTQPPTNTQVAPRNLTEKQEVARKQFPPPLHDFFAFFAPSRLGAQTSLQL
jgi:hypothetical protein